MLILITIILLRYYAIYRYHNLFSKLFIVEHLDHFLVFIMIMDQRTFLQQLCMSMIVCLKGIAGRRGLHESEAFECAARLPSGKTVPVYIATSIMFKYLAPCFPGSRYHFFLIFPNENIFESICYFWTCTFKNSWPFIFFFSESSEFFFLICKGSL